MFNNFNRNKLWLKILYAIKKNVLTLRTAIIIVTWMFWDPRHLLTKERKLTTLINRYTHKNHLRLNKTRNKVLIIN